MTVSPIKAAILVEILRRQRLISETGAGLSGRDWWEWRRQREHGPCWVPGSWFADCRSAADRQRYSRALLALRYSDLVLGGSFTGANRTTHVRLVGLGEEIAKRLEAEMLAAESIACEVAG